MSRYRKTLTEAYNQVRKFKEQDEKDHEVSMARGELEAIADKATQLASMLQGKSDDGNPLEAWVQSKITKAKDYINSVSDYLMYNPDMKQNEEKELEEKFALYALRDFTDTRAPGGMRKKGDRASGPMTYTQAVSKAKQMNAGSSVGGSKDVEVRPMKEELEESHGPKIFSNEKGNIEKVGDKFHVYKGKDKSIHDTLDDAKSALNEATYGWTLVSKAKDLAKKYANNYTKAVDEIEKLQKGLSKNPTVEKELMKYNEDTQRPSPAKPNSKELEEADNYPTSDVNKDKHASYKDPKKGEKKVVDPEPKIQQTEKNIDEVKLGDVYKMQQKGASIGDIAKAFKLDNKTVKSILGEETLEEKTYDEKDIDKFHTALDKIVHKHFGHSSDEKKKEKMDEKVADSIIKDLQKAYGDLKGKTISPEMANKISKHLDQPSYDLDTLRQLVKANIPFISTLARNKIYKKTGKFEELEEKKLTVKKGDKVREINDFEWRTYSQMGYKLVGKDEQSMKEDKYAGARSIVETIQAVKNKAEKTGMPYSILKQVYDRGMAAWKGGHRPGATQQQWALARVNSFVTKSSGTWGGADKDLADKVRGSKK